MAQQYKYLSAEQVSHFLEHGWVTIHGGFTREQAESRLKDVWVRLGMDPNDKSTWARERVHMPWHDQVQVSKFAPEVWGAICDLLGGEDRINPEADRWGDGFIVNLGLDRWETEKIHPHDLGDWHVDGDFFVHYLDSPEQALLVVPLYSAIAPGGGPTCISPDGLKIMAQYLYSHPEGVIPTGHSFTPVSSTLSTVPTDLSLIDPTDPNRWEFNQVIKSCENFQYLTGDIGDVVLMHPLMMHSASKNHTRIPRFITNPPVSLKEPFVFDRPDGNYSLVEKVTLKAVGKEGGLGGWRATGERKRVVPKRVERQAKMLEEEKQRLAEHRGQAHVTAS